MFAKAEIAKGRDELENDAKYQAIAKILDFAAKSKSGGPMLSLGQADQLKNIDALLRFYVVLLGIRRA